MNVSSSLLLRPWLQVRIPARSTEIALRIRKLVRAAAGQHHRRSETGGEC